MKDKKEMLINRVPLDRKVSLLPCPFCGGTPTISELDLEYRFVMCNTCGACINNMDSMPEHDCVEIWNTRANVI